MMEKKRFFLIYSNSPQKNTYEIKECSILDPVADCVVNIDRMLKL